MNHRPIGIGIQGLADVFMILKIPFHSDDARMINKCIFECIYYNALEMSCKLAKADGAYESFTGSPASEGILQFISVIYFLLYFLHCFLRDCFLNEIFLQSIK